MAKDITTDFFNKNIYNLKNLLKDDEELQFLGKRPALVDFYATWCSPCKSLEPILEEVSKDYKGKVDIYKINTENELNLANMFGIRGLPTILFIPMNDEPFMSSGAPSKEDLKEMIEIKLLNSRPES
ncbi:thiol reductase thioredoxin [archaeon]|nr:thiol reductase thioredoxin [archaeon]|tara:strand:- start:1994 stop:2374 length:381 start_codon:yes stop_codon:yes gene_type:complete